ncbi:MAG: hypothetical protein ABFR02_11015 [Campylobacterota bacterium]
MENIYLAVAVYIALELFEIQWQKAENLIGILGRLYRYYKRNIILFFIMHPTFYFGIGLAMITDLAFSAVALLAIKTVDMATKILLIQQVFEKKELSAEMSAMMIAPLHPLMPYLSVVIYTPLVYFAFISLSVF